MTIKEMKRIEQLNDWLAETQMLAHKWMVAHDRLKAGKPYDLPKPADLPEAVTVMREALEKCRDKFREYEGLHALKLRDYDGKQSLNYAAELQFKINRNREMAEMCEAALLKVALPL